VSIEPFDRTAPSFFVTIEGDSGRTGRLIAESPVGAGDTVSDGSARVLNFEYTDSERRADSLKLTIDNFDLSMFDDPAWKKGNAILVRWGYPGRMAPERRCIITKITGALTLTVEARAESVLMNMQTRNRLFEGMSRSSVAAAIAEENGYGIDARTIEDTEVVLANIQQARLTDAQFLTRLAREEGFEWFVDFDGFHFHSRHTDQAPLRVFTYYTDSGMGEILSFNIENDITARPGRIRRRGRNSITGQDVEGEAGTSTEGDGAASARRESLAQGESEEEADYKARLATAKASDGPRRTALTHVIEIVDQDTGSSRVEKRVAQEDIAPDAGVDQDALTRRAAGLHRRHQQTAVKLTFEAVGDPLLLAKTVIDMRGLGRRLSVLYYVKEVIHKNGPGSYTMSVKAVSDGSGGHDTTSRAARGIELLNPGPLQNAPVNTPPATGSDGTNTNTADVQELSPFSIADQNDGSVVEGFRDQHGRVFRTKTEANAADSARAEAGET